jgi:hypothetical protein
LVSVSVSGNDGDNPLSSLESVDGLTPLSSAAALSPIPSFLRFALIRAGKRDSLVLVTIFASNLCLPQLYLMSVDFAILFHTWHNTEFVLYLKQCLERYKPFWNNSSNRRSKNGDSSNIHGY